MYNISREAWLKERCKGIGGSDAAAVLGLSRYKSPLAVYLDKIGEGVPVESTERMEWGLKLEPIILAEYGIRTRLKVEHNSTQKISCNPDHDWLICTLDGIAYHPEKGPGVVQCKNVDRFSQSEWGDLVPREYFIQLYHEIAVTGFSWGALAVLIGGCEFRYFDFDRDEDLISLIIQKERSFWFNNVSENIPPNPTGASLDVLSRIYSRDNGTSLTLTSDEVGSAIVSYLDAKAHLEAYTKQKEDSEAIIKAAMGEAAKGVYQNSNTTYGISWTTVKGRVGFDSKQLEKDQPELFQKYMKPGADYRRFSIKEKKTLITNNPLKEVDNE
jgi:putative phage-type endonuclease